MLHLVTPVLSVAMSVYNGDRFLPEAIASVLEQSFTDFEFLILDDGSSDGTRLIIEDYARRDSRIQPIFRENRGLVASLNQLLGQARAAIVARMDADDICLPERFAKQVAFLNENADYGVVGSWVSDIDDQDQLWPHQVPPLPTTHEEIIAAIDSSDPLFCHPSVMYRRDIVHNVGNYSNAFPHCEDLDLWLRLASETRMANLPEKLLRYRRHSFQVSNLHATLQHTGAAIARLAYQERKEGRADPTADLNVPPQIEDLDTLFGCVGIARKVRNSLALSLQYSRVSLRDQGFEVILRHLRDGGEHRGLWRTVARLLRMGEPRRALRLASTLALTRVLSENDVTAGRL